MISGGENNNMGEQYRRVCICDCNNGRFITSISKKQIEIIYDTIVKASIDSGDWFKDPIKEMVIQTVTELKEYVGDGGGSGDYIK